ncbi:DUF4082 domain-containing protein [Adhaeribacter radiodurans]|uniref:DUF4082 domain-containing protein n=1 Tax=Adhaeribacter radiodurans TaxID=2745197 RepID=A0A7L7LEC6_9BACT|nr:DUF4082 domain-containing protein [Adhaeribacter radiodurans]QMU31024.1 DUF4082 domain-containing protein [Adhaeribacter radiodurans]
MNTTLTCKSLLLAGECTKGESCINSAKAFLKNYSSGNAAFVFLVILSLLLSLGTFKLSAQNAIVTENAKSGNPSSEWQISGAGDMSIQGFATDISYNKGTTARFKIKTNARAYTVKIYRLGYYQGNGARLQGTATVTATLPQTQPSCSTNSSTGLLDCGNWATSAQWVIPSNAVSGVYIAKLTRTDTQGSSHIVFIVRDDASTSNLLFQTSDATWQAYNIYGDNNNGRSLYTGTGGKAVKVSYNRPFVTRSGGGGGGAEEDWIFNAEYPMIRWIESNGYDVSYTTDVDSDRRGNLIANHKVFMSVGHDEYWSGAQRANVTAARNSGTNLAFFSGNEVYWKTRWENSIDGSGTSHRTLVCYKEGTQGENVCGNNCDPSPEWTGLWRSGCEIVTGSQINDGCHPENALTGQISWAENTAALTVPSTFKTFRFWRNTSVASLENGQTATLTNGIIGYEWDSEQEAYRSSYPAGRVVLSRTVINSQVHNCSLYRHSNGALIFGAGTVQYSWGLDSNHDRGSAAPSRALQQATVNLFADMGAQPGSLQTGLVTATASTDTQAPVTTILSPAEGASLPAGTAVTISGTATDANVVAGVEVSTDGGTTWRLANGTTNWTFSWTPTLQGPTTIKSRAFDDLGNMSSPITRNVTIIGGSTSCPCTVFQASEVPTGSLQVDNPVTLGMKFRSSSSGSITGVRFYKQSGNNGTHRGLLYSSTGTLLAEAPFTSETATGWQQVPFPAAVAITANTTYIVAFHSSGGTYSETNDYFTTAKTNGPLTGLANGTDGPNGVYGYGSSPAFPGSTYQATNYWVDVVFNNGAPPSNPAPTVAITSPANGATFTAPASITINANAADTSPGTVSKVDFYNGTTLLGTDVSSPYSFAWSNVAAGTYSLTARATDNGGTTTTSAAVSITVNGSNPPSTCPCTVFRPTDVPGGTIQNDGQSVQLGMKFRSSVNGNVTAVRFYKQTGNTGTHIGQLYSSTGTLLAQATFINETASGWQEVNFSSPVSITANTTYVITYHSSEGHYSVNDFGFTSSIVNGPLTGLQNGFDGRNGVYLYTATPAYPTENYEASNYYVDAVFNTVSSAASTASRLNIATPEVGAQVKLTQAEGMMVYPNPVTHKAKVQFVLVEGGAYTLDLYDAQGRLVKVLRQGKVNAGELNIIEVDGAKLAKGLYLVRLQTNTGAQTAKLLLDR